MADIGTRFTDKRQDELEKRLRRIYSDAAKDIEAKMQDFNRRHKVKEAKYRQMLKDGKITQEDFNGWMKGQVFQGKQWQAKKDQITETLYQSNQIAARIVQGETVGVFAHNANFMSYDLEHTAGVNFGFGIYDSATVTRLIKSQPDLLPKSSVKRSKDKQWNSRKLTEQVTQGIIQGEPLDKIAKRMAQAVSIQDWKFMRTYARTAMTGAQNSGRQLSLQNAKNMGIKVKKEWMATLDGHARTEHRELDGQKVDTDKPFKAGGYTIMYPGDPAAHPAMVYNCRCTLVGDLTDYPSEYERYDNIEGKPIKNMTYQEWESAKKQTASAQPKGITKWTPPTPDIQDVHNAKREYFSDLGAEVDEDGNVTLYHATSQSAAESIRREGFRPNDDPINGVVLEDVGLRSFFGWNRDWVSSTWGSDSGTVMQVKIPAYYLHMAGQNTDEVFVESWIRKYGDIWLPDEDPTSLAWDRRLLKRWKKKHDG